MRAGSSLLLLFSLVAWLGGAAGLRAAGDPPAGEPSLELPKVTVTDGRPLPPPESWRYARVPGLEILSAASDRATRQLLRDFRLFNGAVGVVWPGLKNHQPVPMTLILCGSGRQFDTFMPEKSDVARPSLFLKSEEQAALILNFGVNAVEIPSTENVEANPLSADLKVDYHRQLYREYLRYQLSFIQPALPAWLEAGLSELLVGMRVDPDYIEFARIYQSTARPPRDPQTQEDDDQGANPQPDLDSQVEGDFNSALGYRGLMPLDKFFAVARDSPAARSITGVWVKQAQALVHMWLYGEGRRFHPGFAAFVARSSREPVTEALFKDCFKMSYQGMLTALRIYISDTAYTYQQLSAKKGGGLGEPPPLELRDATQAEIGRIKGEAAMLAGHAEAARDEMLAPYARGVTDGALFASLGLLEMSRRETARARKFLELAARQQAVRPRAYLELAHLRYAEAAAAAGSGLLGAEQARAVMQPLLVARQQPPLLPEVYELMADVWLHSAAAPAKSDLGAINQGVLVFPRRPMLLLHAAMLNGKYGDPAEARTMAEYGSKLARAPEARQAFEEILAALSPAKAR